MKRRSWVTCLAALAALGLGSPCLLGRSQSPKQSPRPTAIGNAVNFGVSQRLSDIREEPLPSLDVDHDVEIPNGISYEYLPKVEDPVVRIPGIRGTMPPPLITFAGIRSADNYASYGYRPIPPDTNGTVGPNHYLQTINILLRVWDKAGNALIPPIRMSSLFAPLGGQCADPHDNGDPIALYDHLADRWLVSQLAFRSPSSPPFHQCIAISQTGDPTGAYYIYDFIAQGTALNDYPHFGIWPDAYYMADNEGGTPGPGGNYAFDRAKMLVGDPAATYIYFRTPNPLDRFLPASLDGPPPPAGTPNYFVKFLVQAPPPTHSLRIFEFHADFDNPASSTFTERSDSPLSVAVFNQRSARIPQPPPGPAEDSLGDRLMHRLQYRNFGKYETLVVNHSVDIGGIAGIRYYELHRDVTDPDAPFTIFDQTSFTLGDGTHRWMGSAGMDHEGNLAVGYSVSSTTTFPSIRYAGRLAGCDPGLCLGEASLVEGSGVQTRPDAFRWGDYSGLSLDPDGCRFWYTTEYYTLASQMSSPVGYLTRIGSFKFPDCTPPLQGTLRGTARDAVSGLPVAGVYIQTSGGYSQVTNASGAYSILIPPGTGTVTAPRFAYQEASVSGVVVTNGGTTTQDFSLNPLAIPPAPRWKVTSFLPGSASLTKADGLDSEPFLCNRP